MTDTLPPLPEPPAAYQYLFDSYYGKVWRNESSSWNGSAPIATRGLHTAEQMTAYGQSCATKALAPLLERIRVLESLMGELLNAREAEAKAYFTVGNADENFTHSKAEQQAHTKAMLRACRAEKAARAALATKEQPNAN